MRPNLLEVVCCPLCQADLEVIKTVRSNVGELIEGTLACSHCRHCFPVANGIPELLGNTYHRATAKAFSLQWELCFRGWFEKRSLYGYDPGRLVNWVFTRCFTSVKGGDWLLDAGCGRGDKTIEIARRYPQAQVVGLDFAETVHLSRKAAKNTPNIHFVRGDLLQPPVRIGVFAKAMSLGVLHTTPDTRLAFRALARMVGASGELAVWLYPNPADSDFANMAYEMRDVHFLSLGHRLPKALLLALLPFYMIVTAPYFLLRYGNQLKDPRAVSFGIVADNLSLLETARLAVFSYLDNLIPEFQDRPLRAKVNEWFGESGFGGVTWEDPGFFWAAKSANSQIAVPSE